MIYKILKVLAWIAVKIYFRKISCENEVNIPKKGAVLLVGNHPNSFLDAVVLAVLMKRPLHFLARSDVFDKPWKQWILSKLHMIPIYRLQEGKENLGKNEVTFERCQKLFEAGQIVLIFPEGLSIAEKRLRKLKKGAAKVAFQSEAAHDFGLDIEVVCVGINYSHPTQARQALMIDFAKPFPMKDFKEEYQAHPAQAIHSLNEEIEKRISDKIVIIEPRNREHFAEQLFILGRNESKKNPENSFLKNLNDLRIEQRITTLLPNIPPKEIQKVEDYFQELQTYHLHDVFIAGNTFKNNVFYLSSYLTLPLYYLGLLFYYPLANFAHQTAEKKVKNTQFYTSVHFALHFGMVLLFNLFLFVFLTFIFHFIYALLGLFASLFLGYFTLNFYEWKQDIIIKRHYLRLFKKNTPLINQLKMERKEIIKSIFSESRILSK